MQKYEVKGMGCAACQARVQKVVSEVKGVYECSVNLLTNSMIVEGTADSEDIIEAVRNAGYDASLAPEDSIKIYEDDREKIKKRLIYSVVLLLFLMYFTMGHGMLGLPLPKILDNNYMVTGLVEMVLSLVIMIINKDFFINGIKGLFRLAPNMDTLVAMGSGVSFIWSSILLFSNNGYALYFESAAMIVTLITVGKLLESISKGKTTDAIKGLMNLIPEMATVIRDGVEVEVKANEIKAGEEFILKPGARVPVDGIVISGASTIDESALTGESIPVDKALGDNISAGTTNKTGYIKARAEKVGSDTTLAQIIQLVSDASSSKTRAGKIADKVSGIFVPAVILISIIVTIIWLFAGENLSYSLARGITVLVISCPCALGLATPVAIMVGNGRGAKNGILFKTAEVLEEAGKIEKIAIDKTGTITMGIPEVTDIILANGVEKQELLRYAISLEEKSEHPFAKAICSYCTEMGISPVNTEEFISLTGSGVSAIISDINSEGNEDRGGKACKDKAGKNRIIAGKKGFIEENAKIPEEIINEAEKLAEDGKTPIFFARDDKVIGVIGLADSLREDSIKAIKELHDMGIKAVMLTGDNEKTAKYIAKTVGVDEVFFELLPEDKEKVIREISQDEKVGMVGDGINDAPALTRADIGIAIGSGTDIAIDSADIVLVNNNLTDVTKAIKLSRATLKNIKENLFWAFFYNILMIPLAGGAFINLFGWTMNPMWGALAMSLSSFCVCMNALRLNRVKL